MRKAVYALGIMSTLFRMMRKASFESKRVYINKNLIKRLDLNEILEQYKSRRNVTLNCISFGSKK